MTMTYSAQAKSRYTSDAVQTASPARLLVMLYDRLVLDLVNAETFAQKGDFEGMGRELQHAQDIVLELRTSLDHSAWDGAAGLDALYTWVFSELVGANVGRDAGRVAAARSIVEPLRDAWRQAALQLLQTA